MGLVGVRSWFHRHPFKVCKEAPCCDQLAKAGRNIKQPSVAEAGIRRT